MPSVTTIASSTTRPIATARPPSDIRFSVTPNQRMIANVPSSVSGTGRAATTPARQSRSEIAITSSDRPMPIKIASRTLRIESSTSSA